GLARTGTAAAHDVKVKDGPMEIDRDAAVDGDEEEQVLSLVPAPVEDAEDAVPEARPAASLGGAFRDQGLVVAEEDRSAANGEDDERDQERPQGREREYKGPATEQSAGEARGLGFPLRRCEPGGKRREGDDAAPKKEDGSRRDDESALERAE